MYSTEGYGRVSASSPFEKIKIERNECGPDDVEFDILYCGVCHSDVSIALNHLGDCKYPIVPGHEVAGKVSKIGANVQNLKPGDKVGVGSIVESCMTCTPCTRGEENYCQDKFTVTFNTDIKHGLIKTNTGYTFGGFSKKMTVHQRYIIKIPGGYPLESSGPLFCAGITMYSPLKHFGVGAGGKRVGIIGIGGLGQMGVRLAAALGNEVTAISRSLSKEAKCKEIGAKHFLVSTDVEAMKKAYGSLDLILNTISAPHQVMQYLPLLTLNGTIVQLGLNLEPHNVNQMYLLVNRTSISGSIIGGIPETQECIDFCAEKGIKPDIEVITNERLDEVFDILDKSNDTAKRYVLDLSKCS